MNSLKAKLLIWTAASIPALYGCEKDEGKINSGREETSVRIEEVLGNKKPKTGKNLKSGKGKVQIVSKKVEKVQSSCREDEMRDLSYPNRFIQCEGGKWALVKQESKQKGYESDSHGYAEGEEEADNAYFRAKREYYEREPYYIIPLTKFEFDEIELSNRNQNKKFRWEQRMARIRIGQKWGIIDVRTGKVIISPAYDAIEIPGLSRDQDVESGWVRVKNNGKYTTMRTYSSSIY